MPNALVACVRLLVTCQSSKKPLPTVPHVDLNSFMATWDVVGYTPILVDGKVRNPTEHYTLKEDEIAAVRRPNREALTGEAQELSPRGVMGFQFHK